MPTAKAQATAVQAPPTVAKAITKASSLGDQEKPCLRNSKSTLKDSAATRAMKAAMRRWGSTGSTNGTSTQSETGAATASPSHATVHALKRSGQVGVRSF